MTKSAKRKKKTVKKARKDIGRAVRRLGSATAHLPEPAWNAVRSALDTPTGRRILADLVILGAAALTKRAPVGLASTRTAESLAETARESAAIFIRTFAETLSHGRAGAAADGEGIDPEIARLLKDLDRDTAVKALAEAAEAGGKAVPSEDAEA